VSKNFIKCLLGNCVSVSALIHVYVQWNRIKFFNYFCGFKLHFLWFSEGTKGRRDVRVRKATTKCADFISDWQLSSLHERVRKGERKSERGRECVWSESSCHRALHSFKAKCNNMLFHFMFYQRAFSSSLHHVVSTLLTGSGFKTFQPYYAITSGMTRGPRSQFHLLFIILLRRIYE